MTDFEIVIAVASTINVLVLVVGVVYAGIQLQQIRKIHREDHDWKRRLAADQAIRSGVDLVGTVEQLNQKFQFVAAPNPIPIETINKAFEQNMDLRVACHRMLNFYEMLARGVRQGIYDEIIIKDARRQVMIMIFNSFDLYIKDRRNINKEAWTRFESLVNQWKAELTSEDDRDPAA